jgi:hypothetical protein
MCSGSLEVCLGLSLVLELPLLELPLGFQPILLRESVTTAACFPKRVGTPCDCIV